MTALEYATDTKATVVGKPEKTFFLEALRGTGCEPEEAVMIGDVSRARKCPELTCRAGLSQLGSTASHPSKLLLMTSDGEQWLPLSQASCRCVVVFF